MAFSSSRIWSESIRAAPLQPDEIKAIVNNPGIASLKIGLYKITYLLCFPYLSE